MAVVLFTVRHGKNMTIKKEAAYHEAAHAVLAHISRFHALADDINLEKYGAGESLISLSMSKCKESGVEPNPINKEITTDLAVILYGGFEGEIIASKNDETLVPNLTCAQPDYELATKQLKTAGLSKKYNYHIDEAKKSLKSNWEIVEILAEYLFKNHTASPDKILEIISNA